MAVPSNYRWVAVGSLLVRARANSSENSPEFSVGDLYDAISARSAGDGKYRSYNNDKRLMWCEFLDDVGGFYQFLIETGDKNVAGMSLFHFGHKISRDVVKEEEEGGHYSAHVLIQKQPRANGQHTVLIERVPGLHLSSIKDHFAWACNDPAFEKTASGPDGRLRAYRAVFEMDGLQSRTIGDALRTGVLQGVEFVAYENREIDGHDEEMLVDEVIKEAHWKIGKRVNQEQARGLFKRAVAYLDDFSSEVDSSQLLVRIKTGSGQVKTTELDARRGELLEQAFIQNEVIEGFSRPLPARYAEFNSEVLEKLRQIYDGLGS